MVTVFSLIRYAQPIHNLFCCSGDGAEINNIQLFFRNQGTSNLGYFSLVTSRVTFVTFEVALVTWCIYMVLFSLRDYYKLLSLLCTILGHPNNRRCLRRDEQFHLEPASWLWILPRRL